MINFISDNKKILFIPIVLVCTISICIYFFIIKDNKTDYAFNKKTSEYEYKVDIKITNNDEIDKKVKKYVNDRVLYTKKSKNYKLAFNTDIKEYNGIITYDYTDLEYKNNEKVYEKHMIYNLKDGKILKINDIVTDITYLKERLYYYALHYSYQNNINTDNFKITDLNDFYLDATGINFCVSINNLIIKKSINYIDVSLKDEFKILIDEQSQKQRVTRNIDDFKDKKVIAITFDDGPAGDTTNRLLDELDKREIKATFFVVGKNVSKYPEIIKRMYINGHDIGIHTNSHANLTKLSDEDIYNEKSSVVELINGLIGYSPTMIRPPYGSIDNRVKSIYPMKNILWNVDSNDWKTKDVNMIYDEIMKSTDDGDIVLLHDLYETSVDGALKSIDKLLKQGYEFVTVSELLQIKGDTKDTYYGF